MPDCNRKKIDYIVVCVDEFAKSAGLPVREAFRYLSSHGGLEFLLEHYDTEHTLSFDDVIDDLKNIDLSNWAKIKYR
jgi:hypothetical protein